MKSTILILIILIATVIILSGVLVSIASYRMKRMVSLEKQEIVNAARADDLYVTEAAVRNLPSPVYKWMHKTGIIGKSAISTAYVKQKALMKMKIGDMAWKTAEAEQHISMNVPAFIWTVKMDMGPLVKIRGRDKFVDGKGEMLIKLNSIINVVKEEGERMDEGTLQRFLGEIVWYPSMALSPFITWEPIDELSAKATMNYKGTSGSGTFHFNEEGDFIKFVALRFMGNEEDAVRYPWVLNVDDYAVFEGITVPSKMKATWKLEAGDWTWLDLEITDIKYNITTIIN